MMTLYECSLHFLKFIIEKSPIFSHPWILGYKPLDIYPWEPSSPECRQVFSRSFPEADSAVHCRQRCMQPSPASLCLCFYSCRDHSNKTDDKSVTVCFRQDKSDRDFSLWETKGNTETTMCAYFQQPDELGEEIFIFSITICSYYSVQKLWHSLAFVLY